MAITPTPSVSVCVRRVWWWRLLDAGATAGLGGGRWVYLSLCALPNAFSSRGVLVGDFVQSYPLGFV
jgi:hypothetical protein